MGLPVCELCDRPVQAACPKRRMRKGMQDAGRGKAHLGKHVSSRWLGGCGFEGERFVGETSIGDALKKAIWREGFENEEKSA